jgi:hypothetical protein
MVCLSGPSLSGSRAAMICGPRHGYPSDEWNTNGLTAMGVNCRESLREGDQVNAFLNEPRAPDRGSETAGSVRVRVRWESDLGG